MPAGVFCLNAAVPCRSNLLCLGHELQTVVYGSACCRDYSVAYGIGDTALGLACAAETCAAR
jgi:hypothetical protein